MPRYTDGVVIVEPFCPLLDWAVLAIRLVAEAANPAGALARLAPLLVPMRPHSTSRDMLLLVG